jgi:hypothetical protein
VPEPCRLREDEQFGNCGGGQQRGEEHLSTLHQVGRRANMSKL